MSGGYDAFMTEVLRRLVAINSVNPAMEAGGPGEAEVAAYVAELLETLCLEVHVHEPVAGRPSVVGVLRGTGGGRSLMLNAHYDTVGVAAMADPFSAEVRDGRLYGRGAYDMKGALAACIGAVKRLAEQGAPAGDVFVAAVADEEDASIGTYDLVKHYACDGAIVTEPTALDVCLAHKGFVWLEVEFTGRAAHGSRPDLGVDANLHAGRLIAELGSLAASLRAGSAHPLLGTGSLHIAQVRGGSGPSTYADRCWVQVERRTIPGETEASVVAEVQAALERVRAADPTVSATLRTTLVRPPFEVGPDAEIVRAVVASAGGVRGEAPRLIGDSPWMDSAVLAAAGTETVVIGPAGAGAHAAEEYVELDSVFRLADILVGAARRYCG